MRPWKIKSTIEENSIGLSKKAVSELLPELDRHVASLFVLFHQLQKHHWLVEGPQFNHLHEFLKETYTLIHNNVDDLAERITALGGIPTCHPAEQVKLSYLEHEPEGAYRVRDMLESNLSDMGEAAQRLRKTAALAGEHGDYGTEHLVKGILLGIEEQAHHLEHYVGFDSLEIGLEYPEQDAERLAS